MRHREKSVGWSGFGLVLVGLTAPFSFTSCVAFDMSQGFWSSKEVVEKSSRRRKIGKGDGIFTGFELVQFHTSFVLVS